MIVTATFIATIGMIVAILITFITYDNTYKSVLNTVSFWAVILWVWSFDALLWYWVWVYAK